MFSKPNQYPRNNTSGYPSQRWTPQSLSDFVQRHPELRLDDNSGFKGLIQQAILFPEEFAEDEDFQQTVQWIIAQQTHNAMSSNDVYWANYPVPGSLSYGDDFVPLGTMLTGDETGLYVPQLSRNVIFLGASGTGKTSLLMNILSQKELLESVCIILFARKPEVRHLAAIPGIEELIVVFRLTYPPEFQLACTKPPGNMPEQLWVNEVTQIFAKNYGRYSAQRLMAQKLHDLMAYRPKDHYPTPENLRDVLLAYKPAFHERRQADYRESILTCLCDLINSTEGLWVSNSTFLDKLFDKPGLYIFEAESLAQEHLSFIATLMIRYLYFKKIYGG